MNRRAQPALTIRSAKAVDRLKLLTRDGRSQVDVIEEALDRMPEPVNGSDRYAVRNEILGLIDAIRSEPRVFATMAEFDAHEYDEFGNPR